MHLLAILFVLLLSSFAHASFDENNLAALYRLIAGVDVVPRCGDLLDFSSSGTTIPAANISLDNKQCAGGSMNLVKNPPQGGTGFVRFFARNPGSGDFFSAELSNPLTCGSKTFSQGTTFVFIRPDEDITITWEDTAGPDTPLEAATSSVYTFFQDTSYIILNNRCLFSRDDNPNLSIDTGSVCFPSTATVLRDDGLHLPISHLRTGDRVAVGRDRFSPVFAWTHRRRDVRAPYYVAIDAGLDKPLTLTPSHFVYASGRVVPAALVRKGDIMTSANGSAVVVRAVAMVQSEGLFNPQTLHGDIIVDGLLVTTYTTTLVQPVAHAFLAPFRAAFRGAGECFGNALLAAADVVRPLLRCNLVG